MVEEIPGKEDLDFPYQEEHNALIEEIEPYESHFNPENTEMVSQWNLDHGWKAVMYKKSESFLDKVKEKVTEVAQLGNTTNTYGIEPEYKWELVAPNDEVYRTMGVELNPIEFDKKVIEFKY